MECKVYFKSRASLVACESDRMGVGQKSKAGHDVRSLTAKVFKVNLIKLFFITLATGMLVQTAMAQGTQISGLVRDDNGDPIAGARVSLIDKDGRSLVAVTNEAGRFEIAYPDPSRVAIAVSAAGFSQFKGEWTGQPLEIVLHPAPISEEIKVTRTGSQLGDTASSIVVLDRDRLSATPALTVDDKLRQITGFTLFRRAGSRTANPTTQGVSLRGTGGSGASRASVIMDGFPLNDPFGGWVYWGRIPVDAIENVEVLRGAASDLWGNSAIGGVVSIASRGATTKPQLDLQASIGSQNTAVGSMFMSAGIGDWKASLSSEGLTSDGSVTIAQSQRGSVDVPAGVRRYGLSPSFEYKLGKSSRLFAILDYFTERRGNGTPLQNNDTRTLAARFGIDWNRAQVGPITLRGWLQTQAYHQSFSAIAANRNSESLNRLQTVPSQSFGSSLQWNRSFAAVGSIYFGAEVRSIWGSSDEIAVNAGLWTSLSGSGGHQIDMAAFAGGVFEPDRRLVLSGGVRFDSWREQAGYNDTRSLLNGQFARISFSDRTESAVNPRGSVLIRVKNGISVTASISTGFRQPTLNELYRTFRVGNVLTLANENLRAERAINADGGILANAFGDRFYFRAVGYCININRPVANLTLATTPTLITRQRQNLGSTRSCGIEVDSEMRLRKDLDISTGYLFANAKVTSFPADRSLVGLRVPQVPNDQLALQMRYTNPKIAFISLQLRAADGQFDDDQNQFRLKGFATVDLLVSRRLSDHAEILFAAENLFDNTIESGRTPVLTITGQRSIRAGVRLRFFRRD
jgi:outer membrane receptor protein involved in Fe transport